MLGTSIMAARRANRGCAVHILLDDSAGGWSPPVVAAVEALAQRVRVCAVAPLRGPPRCGGGGAWASAYMQFYALSLSQYDIVQFMDSDTVLVRSTDGDMEAFGRSGDWIAGVADSAPPDAASTCGRGRGWTAHFSTAYLLIRPNTALLAELVAARDTDDTWDCRYSNQVRRCGCAVVGVCACTCVGCVRAGARMRVRAYVCV